ncbi:hypothetical protein F5B18DRAFT_635439 [Nemania serpens]|nr:hypothetical protein F5B18DRAFT_635439 [Nemania serpens]
MCSKFSSTRLLGPTSFCNCFRGITHETGVLVGVHGAGLTHLMFMRQGAGALVGIQPQGLDHHGFKNLAGMRDLGYFRAHARILPPEDWVEGEMEILGHSTNGREELMRLNAGVPLNGTLIKKAITDRLPL